VEELLFAAGQIANPCEVFSKRTKNKNASLKKLERYS
jgi:hypothetical protein